VWYPESGDVFKYNIVFGAYRPAVMQRALAPDAKWGKELDYNLFATNQEDLEKFMVNGCDSNSVVGDPLFINPTEGDFRVKENSPAFKIGFQNFPMDNFGVVSEKLKKIAKAPEMPQVINSSENSTGKVYNWLGGKVKNIETLGEQSANGLSSMSGVLILDVPENSDLAKFGFKKSDVIVAVNGKDIKMFNQLSGHFKTTNEKTDLKVSIMRDQKMITLNVEQ
jgi:membrane-associated protease RseP (regulator of RpoE activity)